MRSTAIPKEVFLTVMVFAMPEFFMAIGHWYQDFSQTEDDEVTLLLAKAHEAI